MWFSLRSREPHPVFVHPLDPTPRTAILVPGFRSTRRIRVFPDGWTEACAKFSPGAIAGSFDRLIQAADLGASPTHAVISLSWDMNHRLAPHLRNTLWDRFGVPVFEQVLGPGNALLAYECEAHTSLHATAEYRDGLEGQSGAAADE
jgi:hypothetical protein